MNGNLRTIGRDVGRILQVLPGMMFVSIPIAIIWGEFYAVGPLVVSGILPLLLGRSLVTRFADADDPGKLHGMMIAAISWGLAGVFGMVPFFLIAWLVALDPTWIATPPGTNTLAVFRDPLNALFESLSGYTGTGLTMTMNEEVLPRTLQWWRSFTEWVGGVGVIVLTTAILARPGSGSLTLYESEARSEKIHPSIISTVRSIWWIFILFTFISIGVLWLAGMPTWDAINHAMTGLSTGGFSVTDQSIATYDSPLIDFALIPIMILGSIAFPIHYLVLEGHLENIYADLQTRWVFGFFGVGTAALTAILYLDGPYESLFQAFRYGSFQFVSAASCAGFQTAMSIGTEWPALAQLTVASAMIVGAAAGSTAGGIKLIRAITLIRGTIFRITSVFYPDTAVRRFRIGDRRLSEVEASQEFEEAAIIAFLWVIFLLAGMIALLIALPTGTGGFTLENIIFEVASAQGNVGVSTGITGPTMPTLAKVAFLFNMWIGRLEIIPVLVLLRSVFKGFDVYT